MRQEFHYARKIIYARSPEDDGDYARAAGRNYLKPPKGTFYDVLFILYASNAKMSPPRLLYNDRRDSADFVRPLSRHFTSELIINNNTIY